MYDKPIQITEHLYLGDVDMSNEAILQQYDITAVIRFVSGPPLSGNIDQLHIYLQDSPFVNIKRHFSTIVNFIDAHKEQNRKVLVHCYAGISRSATAVIAYVMWTKKMSFAKAYHYVWTRSPVIGPNAGFVVQLKEFDEYLSHLRNQNSNAQSLCNVM